MHFIIFVPAIYFPAENLLSVLSDSSSFTSLTISWELDQNLTVSAYTISYSAKDCFTGSNTIPGIAGSETMYTLTGLEEGTGYFVTVTVTITGGGTRHYSVRGTTKASGETTCLIPLPPQS